MAYFTGEEEIGGRGLSDVEVTLNGRPAMIIGMGTRFPRVVDIETGLGAEWSHKAIDRCLASGGDFRS